MFHSNSVEERCLFYVRLLPYQFCRHVDKTRHKSHECQWNIWFLSWVKNTPLRPNFGTQTVNVILKIKKIHVANGAWIRDEVPISENSSPKIWRRQMSSMILTLPVWYTEVLLLEALVIGIRWGLVCWVGVLSQVGMCKRLFCSDACVRIKVKHSLKQIDSYNPKYNITFESYIRPSKFNRILMSPWLRMTVKEVWGKHLEEWLFWSKCPWAQRWPLVVSLMGGGGLNLEFHGPSDFKITE